MRFSYVLFLIAISTKLAVSDVTMKSLVFPNDTQTNSVEMKPLKYEDLVAFTLCMRVATELSGEREFPLFSYRIPNIHELDVWLGRDGRLFIALTTPSASDSVDFHVPALGALETHLCVTWESSSGAAAIFMDGKKSLTKIYKKGEKVALRGNVTLGLIPGKQSFAGEICDVNMWDYVLSDSTIQDMFSGKVVPRGNVFDWETTHPTPHGGVVIINHKL